MSVRLKKYVSRSIAATVTALVASAALTAPASGDPRCQNNDPFYGYCVGGKILEEFNQAGGLGFFGNATNTELPALNGGRWQPFAKGSSIYWHRDVSGGHANQIGGLIRDKWGELGYDGGSLGYPTTRERPTRVPGRFNHFQGGSVYWSTATGAHSVWGEIRDSWAISDWEAGPLGFPTSDEYDYNGGKRQDFQGGHISWNAMDVEDGLTDDTTGVTQSLSFEPSDVDARTAPPPAETTTPGQSDTSQPTPQTPASAESSEPQEPTSGVMQPRSPAATTTTLNPPTSDTTVSPSSPQPPGESLEPGAPDAQRATRTVACNLTAHDPHDSSHRRGTANAEMTITCAPKENSIGFSYTVSFQLFRDGTRVVSPSPQTKTVQGNTSGTTKFNVGTKCVPGQYQAFVAYTIRTTPGWKPSAATGLLTSNKREVKCDKMP